MTPAECSAAIVLALCFVALAVLVAIIVEKLWP